MEISKDLFQPVGKEEVNRETIVRPSMTNWQDAWRRLKKNKLAMFGLITLILLTLLSIFGPILSKFDYATQNYDIKNMGPSAVHWFGTDDFGRDLWVRVWWGTRISLAIGITAALLDLVFGVIYGGISAYYGGRVDDIMQRFIEIIYSIPFLLISILLIIVIGPGFKTIIIAYAITGWVPMARLVRGQVLQLKEQEYVLAARTLGAGGARIIMKHLVPNALGLIIVQITFIVPSAIFVEAFLSFIGLGIRVPLASLGSLLSDGANSIRLYPHRVIFPTLLFSLILMSFNLLGDGLRDALDPKMRK
ncbi:ABC transporter permease [Paenibacillus validus]|uniref:ABC transporter permease subunit n=1 Tax=Paenibacillus validus TaxID=44253 RepID=A0A7X2ZCS9_9BACL|nr:MULTISPECIES: ABC transporter permease [Paenibacillus]MED4601119.1 ABC transporter permease [Paenibacillus validus]MED4608205.1 ABC transporter permease [Paenibacillus validus]MUG72584.1 ABC transporter permease subunit [Paenibacillus validus]